MGQGQSQTAGFRDDTLKVISDVRDAFGRVIESKCSGPQSVSALAQTFQIHRKLAWQVSRVTYGDDPFDAAAHMPSSKSLDAWLSAAQQAQVPEPLVEAARKAGERFTSTLSVHAKNSTEIEMMLDAMCQTGDEQTDARWREHAFIGNSYVLGARCRLILAMCVLQPSRDMHRFFHVVQVRGLMGYSQMRPNVNWTVGQSIVAHDERVEGTPDRVALDPQAASMHEGVPVLPAFCSTPMPALRRRVLPDGMVQDEFVDGPVGRTGERSLVTGEVIRNIAPAHATPDDQMAHFGVAIRTPAELLHFDLFTHRSLFGDVERELCVFSDLRTPVTWSDQDALPVHVPITRMGRGISFAQTPDIPGYPDLAASVFEQLDDDPNEYVMHRVRMAYPPLPTTIMVRHPLPPP